MTPWLVLPFKSLAAGKSRLAPWLSPDERRALNTQLLERSLELATAFAGPSRTLVVSHCDEVLARAARWGALCLTEPAPGLNEGLTHATRFLRRTQVGRLVVLAGDLPLADDEDLAALAAAQEGIALATDRAGTGTNALSLPIGVNFHFQYGASSRQLHAQEAARLGLRCRVLERPGLAFDLDTAHDWQEWRRRHNPQANLRRDMPGSGRHWAVPSLMDLA